MNIPDETAYKLLDWLWAALTGALVFLWRLLTKRHEELRTETMKHIDELKEAQAIKMTSMDSEITRQRDVSAKIFDKLESMSKESADRHERLLTALHNGLAGKVDK